MDNREVSWLIAVNTGYLSLLLKGDFTRHVISPYSLPQQSAVRQCHFKVGIQSALETTSPL
jgi:hypothetical protein